MDGRRAPTGPRWDRWWPFVVVPVLLLCGLDAAAASSVLGRHTPSAVNRTVEKVCVQQFWNFTMAARCAYSSSPAARLLAEFRPGGEFLINSALPLLTLTLEYPNGTQREVMLNETMVGFADPHVYYTLLYLSEMWVYPGQYSVLQLWIIGPLSPYNVSFLHLPTCALTSVEVRMRSGVPFILAPAVLSLVVFVVGIAFHMVSPLVLKRLRLRVAYVPSWQMVRRALVVSQLTIGRLYGSGAADYLGFTRASVAMFGALSLLAVPLAIVNAALGTGNATDVDYFSARNLGYSQTPLLWLNSIFLLICMLVIYTWALFMIVVSLRARRNEHDIGERTLTPADLTLYMCRLPPELTPALIDSTLRKVFDRTYGAMHYVRAPGRPAHVLVSFTVPMAPPVFQSCLQAQARGGAGFADRTAALLSQATVEYAPMPEEVLWRKAYKHLLPVGLTWLVRLTITTLFSFIGMVVGTLVVVARGIRYYPCAMQPLVDVIDPLGLTVLFSLATLLLSAAQKGLYVVMGRIASGLSDMTRASGLFVRVMLGGIMQIAILSFPYYGLTSLPALSPFTNVMYHVTGLHSIPIFPGGLAQYYSGLVVAFLIQQALLVPGLEFIQPVELFSLLLGRCRHSSNAFAKPPEEKLHTYAERYGSIATLGVMVLMSSAQPVVVLTVFLVFLLATVLDRYSITAMRRMPFSAVLHRRVLLFVAMHTLMFGAMATVSNISPVLGGSAFSEVPYPVPVMIASLVLLALALLAALACVVHHAVRLRRAKAQAQTASRALLSESVDRDTLLEYYRAYVPPAALLPGCELVSWYNAGDTAVLLTPTAAAQDDRLASDLYTGRTV